MHCIIYIYIFILLLHQMVYQAPLCVSCPWSYLVYFMSWVWSYLVNTSQMPRPVSHCLEQTRNMNSVTTHWPPLCSDRAECCFSFTYLTFYPVSNLGRRLIFVVEVYPKNWQSASFSFPCYLRLFSISNFFLTGSIKMSQNLLLDNPQSAWDLLRVCVFQYSVFSWVWYQRCRPIWD